MPREKIFIHNGERQIQKVIDEKKNRRIFRGPFFVSVHEKIRTPDTLVRSQVLYPAELHAHVLQQSIFYSFRAKKSIPFFTIS